jgi:hypothetical protein
MFFVYLVIIGHCHDKRKESIGKPILFDFHSASSSAGSNLKLDITNKKFNVAGTMNTHFKICKS